eukprot:GFUD01031947.1.p1 GENE.GFUD01031947.1~~GFUD01031947.1.p1  ORF type:complete len:608 (-),score=236.46 GFUD01031947.1:72-1895(-)
MGAKFSKAGKVDKCNDGVVDESSDTFDKTSTLPATFKKKDEEANKAGTLPRGGLDRSTSFSKRFRKSMTRLVGHKKGTENAKLPSEPTEPNAASEGVEEEGKKSAENEVIKEEVEIEEEAEDTLKTAQLKARAQFFEDMYNSKEPVNKPKLPVSNVPSPIEKVTDQDEVQTVSVSVIGTPVVKLIEKHETQQETPEPNTDTVVEVVEKIVDTKQEMVTSAESKQAGVHEEVNEQSEVQLVNDNSGETMTAESVEEKIIETVTEKLDTIDEVMVTCTVNDAVIERDVADLLTSEQKVEHPEKVECEDIHDNSQTTNTKEGVNSKNEAENVEEKYEESFIESTKEEKCIEINHEKPDAEIVVPVMKDVCTEEANSCNSIEESEELKKQDEDSSAEESLNELEQNPNLHENETGKDEQTSEESIIKSMTEEEVEEIKHDKSDNEIEVPVIEDGHTEKANNSDTNEEMEGMNKQDEDSEGEESLNELEQNTNLHQDDETEQNTNLLPNASDKEEEIEETESNDENEKFEVVTSDMINDAEVSGEPSLESKFDDISSEGGSEGGITTDEGIVASEDEEKDKEDDPKLLKLDVTEEPKRLELLTDSPLVTHNE